MISSISRLQGKSSEFAESNIQRNLKDMYSSNTTAIYDTSSFSTSCSKSLESNPTTHQKGSIFFTGENNTQKMMTSNETRLTVSINDITISEDLSSNLSQKPRFKKVLELGITVLKCY